jgi:proteic killer suppression protein
MLATCYVTGYTVDMIKSFRHNGLKRLYEKGDGRRISPEHVEKIIRILDRLDASEEPGDMALPGYRLHPLRGDLEGSWSVMVSGNWRITFRFDGLDAYDVDYLDYHGK